MAVGDDITFSEQLYVEMIGRYVATIEVLSKRLVAKDQHIAQLTTEIQMANSKPAKGSPKDGEVKFGKD